jgi:Flp pilus assembly protein TadD
VREEITRSAPKERRDPALGELAAGLSAFAEERYGAAAGALRKAKSLAPRSATIRELLGLATYHLESWEEALRELRTFRRLAGDTEHLAVEMDCLRALGRDRDVEKVWDVLAERGATREAEDELRVVYASFLVDRGRVAEAWDVIRPGRLVADPAESTLRRWAVAARVAATSGDRQAAGKLIDAIRRADADIEWLADLEVELGL